MAWVRTDAPGSTDEAVLARAIRERRVLITFDKDFGELAAMSDLPTECGVILFRVPMRSPAAAAALARVVESRTDSAGHFSVIEPSRVRMRPLPRSTP